MMSKKNKLRIIIGSVVVLVVLCLSFTLFLPKFKVKEFMDLREVIYEEEFNYQPGVVCYGNIFSCEEVGWEVKRPFEEKVLGEQEIIYEYSYKEKKYEKSQTIVVKDNTSPVLEIKDTTFTYCPNKKSKKYDLQAIDNYDGDITDKVEIKVEDKRLIFSVTDSSNNTTTIEKEAIEEDKEPPLITVNEGEYVYLKKGEKYEEKGATVTDNCDELTDALEITGNVDTNKEGKYTVTYKVQDKSGNVSTKTRFVFVTDSKTVSSEKKKVYLTFDDGPGPYTEKLLDVLKKYNVKVTFFVTNQSLTKNYDHILKRAYEEGHTIGLHSFSHDYSIYTNEKTYFDDLYAIQDKVKRITGYTSTIIRFPGGSSNRISEQYDNGEKIMTKLTQKVKEKGFLYYDWNVISGDAGETTNTNVVVSNVIEGISKKTTSMILQHDIKEFSVNAVENIIEYGLKEGYEFLPITVDTEEIHHRINN